MKVVGEYSQNVNTKFKLFCTLQNFNSNQINTEWFHDGQLLPLRGSNYQIDSFDDSSVLTISRLSTSDSGNYSCRACSQLCDIISTILKVNGKSTC